MRFLCFNPKNEAPGSDSSSSGTQSLNCSPPEGCELEAFNAVLNEALQISLADATNGVDISTGAVVLGQVTTETEQNRKFYTATVNNNVTAA